MDQIEKSKHIPKKISGDRIVQIILLTLIAAGLISFILIIVGGSAGRASDPGSGGPPGAATRGEESGALDEGESNAVAVQADVVGRSDVREYIRVNGDVESESSVHIYPNISGKITNILVSLGDTVRPNQAIALVNSSVPGQVFRNSGVNSTISGTVTALNYDIGETVTQQSAIAVIGNLSNLEIVAFVPERYVGSLQTGLTAEVALDAYPGEVFNAMVTEISPVLDATSRTVQVTLSPVSQDSRIKAGMFASVQIVINEALGTISVPTTALSSYYDQDIVYVIENETAQRRDVAIGLRSADSVQILDGLSEGELIAVQGLSGITSGSAVRIVN